MNLRSQPLEYPDDLTKYVDPWRENSTFVAVLMDVLVRIMWVPFYGGSSIIISNC